MLERETPIIRAARRDDIPELSALIAAALSEFLKAAPVHLVERHIETSRDIESQWSRGQVLVMDSDGELLGGVVYYAAQLGMGFPAEWAGMRTLVVSPSARGRGFGRALVRHCVDCAKVDGAAVFGLHTSAYMENAIYIYQATGFVRCPEYDLSASKLIGADASLGDIPLMAYRLDLASV
jgi:predicted N-acetyltransferase YhbS